MLEFFCVVARAVKFMHQHVNKLVCVKKISVR